MSLSTNVQNLATRIATEFKSIRTLINGNATDLSALTTTAKSNLVLAINEVKASAGTGGATINDTTPSTTSVYSSTKTNSAIAQLKSDLTNGAGSALDTFKEFQDAIGNDPSYAATTATALGNRVRFDTAQTLTSGQQTQAQSNMNVLSATQVGDTTTDFVATFVAGLA